MNWKIVNATIIGSIATIAILAGCLHPREPMGAAADNDQNVLTGGPITGITLQDLPRAVKETLKIYVPHAEIADIDQSTNGQMPVYVFSFTRPDEAPKIGIAKNGRLLTEEELQKLISKR